MAITPSNIVVAPAAVSVNGTDVGAIEIGGATLTYEREYLEVDSDSASSLLDIVQHTERLRCTFGMLEATLDNLRLCWDLAQAIIVAGGSRVLQFGGMSVRKGVGGNAQEVIITSMSPGYGGATGTRTITLWEAVFMGAGEMQYAKDAKRIIPVELLCQEKNAQPEGQRRCKIVDA